MNKLRSLPPFVCIVLLLVGTPIRAAERPQLLPTRDVDITYDVTRPHQPKIRQRVRDGWPANIWSASTVPINRRPFSIVMPTRLRSSTLRHVHSASWRARRGSRRNRKRMRTRCSSATASPWSPDWPASTGHGPRKMRKPTPSAPQPTVCCCGLSSMARPSCRRDSVSYGRQAPSCFRCRRTICRHWRLKAAPAL